VGSFIEAFDEVRLGIGEGEEQRSRAAYSVRGILLNLGRKDENLGKVEEIVAEMEKLSKIETTQNMPLATRIYKVTTVFFGVEERARGFSAGHDMRPNRKNK